MLRYGPVYGLGVPGIAAGGMMAKEPTYYEILGLQPDADGAAIEAAYRGRSLRFKVGQPRTRAAEQAGPTQEQIEQAYAILGDPESRTLYDAVYFPLKQPRNVRQRRVPPWLGALGSACIVALLVVGCIGIRSRAASDGGAIGRIIGQRATASAVAGGVSATPSSGPSVTAGNASPTSAAALPAVTAIRTAQIATATVPVTLAPSVTAIPTTAPSPTPTVAPTATAEPTATATLAPPPTATPLPPPTVASAPEPEPTAVAPSFRATDRIGTALSVNLRSGPGAYYASLGLLPTGTLLQATGETAVVGGQLWRRFILEDGRVGWVRDLDVFSVR